MGNALHYPAGSASDDDADNASGDADKNGFDEELAQDVDTAGAYTHAQADFARAFRHRYVHDVHNADAAHYERNAGYAGKQRGHQVGGGVQHGAEFLLAANGEVVVVTLLQLVVAAQYLGDLVGGIVRHVLGEGGGEDAAKVGLCQQAFHHGAVGGKHYVVLVHAHGVVAFGLQHAHHAEGHLVETDDTSHGVLSSGKEVVLDGLSDDAHLGRGLYVGFGKHLAVLHAELPDFEIVRAHAAHGGRVVVVARDELPAGGDIGADGSQKVGFVAQGFVVGQLQGLHGAGVLADTAAHVGTGVNHNHVGAHLGDLRLDAFLRTLSDGKHRDDGRHADDDAQHGEECAQLVVVQGSQGYFEKVCSVHIVLMESLKLIPNP